MKKLFSTFLLLSLFPLGQVMAQGNPPIYIAFLWHMHQPIYWPGETVVQTENNQHYGYSVIGIHTDRTGPYTSWPKDAVMKGINAGMAHFGAQVSFTGSLTENLNVIENAGIAFSNWKSNWNYIKNQTTSLNNPRIDMVGMGHYHPLMGLIDESDIRRQIQEHRATFATHFPGNYSKGIFPPENAFSTRMIPALVSESLEWVLVDNIHLERACSGYPFSTSGNLVEPNHAEVMNPNPSDWISLNGLWAPTQVSARWANQPHYSEYIDPVTGISSQIIIVPASRYLGTEDARGGFGALQYDYVMSQFESYNTDPAHPILFVLAHDGDNYGGGSESYYNGNFQQFVNWLQSNPGRFVCTTIQDYLDMFPPAPSDIIHSEPGSWSGADNGDPEFKKWNADPYNGYSSDRNSWGVVTAAKNYVFTANQIAPANTNTIQAYKSLITAETSCYWYWDGTQGGIWDSHPTRACNTAIQSATPVVQSGSDLTPPTIYFPQREPYNPGGTEWGVTQPSDFTVWSYVYDLSNLTTVTLKYRTDLDGSNSWQTTDNETYAGGNDVTSWQSLTMNGIYINPQTDPLPIAKAMEYSAVVSGLNNVLVDYYIEATDTYNNVARSPIQHVWVGEGGSGPGGISWVPQNPTKNDVITITVPDVTQGGKLHWGVNINGTLWQSPDPFYWPVGSYLFNGTGPAVESPMDGPGINNELTIELGPFNNPAQVVQGVDFVIHFNDNTWNNNNGQDYHIPVNNNVTVIDDPSFIEAFLAEIYPNPASDYFTAVIAGPTGHRYSLIISDLSGRVMQEQPAGPGSCTIHCKPLPSGIYIVTIRDKTTHLEIKKKLVIR